MRYYCMTLIEFAGTETSIAPSFAASKLECRVARIMDKPFAKGGKSLERSDSVTDSCRFVSRFLLHHISVLLCGGRGALFHSGR